MPTRGLEKLLSHMSEFIERPKLVVGTRRRVSAAAASEAVATEVPQPFVSPALSGPQLRFAPSTARRPCATGAPASNPRASCRLRRSLPHELRARCADGHPGHQSVCPSSPLPSLSPASTASDTVTFLFLQLQLINECKCASPIVRIHGFLLPVKASRYLCTCVKMCSFA
jgi:hypothetical protein